MMSKYVYTKIVNLITPPFPFPRHGYLDGGGGGG